MDYYDRVALARHSSWDAFLKASGERRIVLLTTKAATPYIEYEFRSDDIILVGRESAGVPEDVHERANGRIVIPMGAHIRSFNVAMAAAIIATALMGAPITLTTALLPALAGCSVFAAEYLLNRAE